MILLDEIEVISQKIWKYKPISVKQINKATIRIDIGENSFIDVFQSFRDQSKFAVHAKLKKGGIYRLDCRPEEKYANLKTYPWHFHERSEKTVISSPFSADKRKAIQEFLRYIRKKLEEFKSKPLAQDKTISF